jgi:uncharacterized protein
MNTEAIRPAPLISDAIRHSNQQELEKLFENYPEMRSFHFPAFGTWLHFAAAHSSPQIVDYLVGIGYDINSRENREGDTPLNNACNEGKAETVEYLLNHGAELDVSTSVRNPLFGAIVGRSPDCARLLIDAGIDTRASYILEGEVKIRSDAIAFAMLRGETEIANMVALHNADGDDAKARELVAEGDRIAELRTAA